jgi:long-chain acyl-CoA synthetase
VFPAEVESVLLEVPNIADAIVFGAPNPITGQVVRAKVVLESPEEPRQLQSRIKQYCRSQLEPFKVPFSIEVSETALHGGRFKKSRGPEPWPGREA